MATRQTAAGGVAAPGCGHRLEIVADDLGFCEERDAMLNLLRCGIITRASLLVNGRSTVSAVESLKQGWHPAALPDCVGLHLNLTEGYPVSSPAEVSTLVDGETGMFFGKHRFRERLKEGMVDVEHLRTEILAQICEFAHLLGFKPAWVDGHQHVHVLPGVCICFAELLNHQEITQTRVPFEVGIPANTFLGSVCVDAENAALMFSRFGLTFGVFVGLSTMGYDMKLERVLHALAVNTGLLYADITVVEWMVHPGKASSSYGDTFNRSHAREHEYSFLRKHGSMLKEHYTNGDRLPGNVYSSGDEDVEYDR